MSILRVEELERLAVYSHLPHTIDTKIQQNACSMRAMS